MDNTGLHEQFAESPNARRDPRFHGRRNAQRLVNPAEVVPREMQAVCRPQVFPPLRECVRQPRETTHAHPDRQVLALDVAGANLVGIGFPNDWDLLRVGNIGRAVLAALFFRGLRVDLHELCEIAAVAEPGGDRGDVRLEAIGADLEALRGRCGGAQSLDEHVRHDLAAAPEGEVQSELRVALDDNEAVSIADAFMLSSFASIGSLCASFFRT